MSYAVQSAISATAGLLFTFLYMYIVVRFYLINSSNSVLNEMCVVQHKCVAAVRWFNWTDDRWQTGRSLSLNSVVMSAVCRVSDQWIFIIFDIIIIIIIRYSDPVTKTFRFLMSSRIQPCLQCIICHSGMILDFSHALVTVAESRVIAGLC